MAKQEAKKERRPKAQKRDLQNQKRRSNNKMYKSQVRTAIRSFQDAVTKKDENQVKSSLSVVYSLLDKCAKKGVYKINKVSRTKSRLAARAVTKS